MIDFIPINGVILLAVVRVVIQFLSVVVPSAEMVTPFLLQLLALCLSTLLDSGHSSSSNQSSLSPFPLASSRSSLVVLAFCCHSLQNPEQLSKQNHHPSSAHVLMSCLSATLFAVAN